MTPPIDASSTSGRFRWRALLNRLFRLGCIAVILTLGWQVAQAYRSLFSGPDSAAPEPLDLKDVAFFAPVELLAGLPEAGPWTFAGVPWKMTSRILPSEEIEKALLEPYPAGGTPLVLAPKDDPRRLLEFLRWKELRQGSLRVFHHRGHDMALALALDEGPRGERWVGGRLAFPSPQGTWRLLEIVPSPGTKVEDEVSALLPLPAPARRLASRTSATGKVLAELWRLEEADADEPASWRPVGWKVREVEDHRPGTFRLYVLDRETVGAWWLSSGTGRGFLVLLVRASTP